MKKIMKLEEAIKAGVTYEEILNNNPVLVDRLKKAILEDEIEELERTFDERWTKENLKYQLMDYSSYFSLLYDTEDKKIYTCIEDELA